MDKIKIGDYIGRQNFPFEISEVIDIQGDVYVVKLSPRRGSGGKDILRGITLKQIEMGFFTKLNVVEGKIIKDKKKKLPL